MSLKPEVWGGIECTINRIGNVFYDQLELARHYDNEDDIDRFISLGIKSMRYPILWEKHEVQECKTIDWNRTEKQLEKLRVNGVNVIAGLVHHGSGPLHTHLLDPFFPERLYEYALRVARRFPWITCYTPINEPLTTARFSGLYGLWYPHHKYDTSFVKMVINQTKATVLAMHAIRSVNPMAKLIQTEDLSKTHSTPLLAYQAEFENHRRWLSIDLLYGKVDHAHPLWEYLIDSGATEEELNFFVENCCPPDIIGWNYYVTSERYLDDDVLQYPNVITGGNAKHEYVDVEAVHTRHCAGLSCLLREAADRYNAAMAITEAHIGCTREEQMRWLMDIWKCCLELNRKGHNIVAVTPWALLGSFNWANLLTEQKNEYECGVFDISSGTRRSTVLAKVVQALSTTGHYNHPLLSSEGWWRKNIHGLNVSDKWYNQVPSHYLLIVGNEQHFPFETMCERRSIPFVSVDDVSLYRNGALGRLIKKSRAWAVIYLEREYNPPADLLIEMGESCIASDSTLMIILPVADQPLHGTVDALRIIAQEESSPLLIVKTALLTANKPVEYNHRLVQTSLDLLTDDARGIWTVDESCAKHTIVQSQLEPQYN